MMPHVGVIATSEIIHDPLLSPRSTLAGARLCVCMCVCVCVCVAGWWWSEAVISEWLWHRSAEHIAAVSTHIRRQPVFTADFTATPQHHYWRQQHLSMCRHCSVFSDWHKLFWWHLAAWLSGYDVGLWLADFPWSTHGLWLTCDHFVGKVSAMDHPTRPTQPSIPSGSVNE